MPLIKCPECGREVSTSAVACPHCGFPVASYYGQVASNKTDDEQPKYTNETNYILNPSEAHRDTQQGSGSNYNSTQSSGSVDEGSYAIGFILSFFLGWIGLIIALVMKQPKTKKAALITFFITLAIDTVIIIIYVILITTGVISIQSIDPNW